MSTLWVNVYKVTRHYGGPEEGGWWYNAGEPIHTESCDTEAEAESMKARLEQLYADQKHGNIYSVNGGVDIDVYVEGHEGKPWPETIPHYE